MSRARAGRPGTVGRIVVRVACHLLVEVPPFVVAGVQIAKGWLPTSDDAVIAWRSWSVFSGPVPLDGQFSQISASGHHVAFDLGPLQYYLLALPERIDPLHGLLWGAALLVAVLAGLAVEAAWSAAGVVGGVVASAGVALMTATLVESTVNLAWNPSVGVYAFVATLACAVALATGRFAWLPVGIGTGALAIQSHMVFVVASIGVLVVGLVVGVVHERALRSTPLIVGTGVGVAAFAAPLWQELTGNPGNWSVVVDNLGRFGPTVGIQAGLRGVASATALWPSWRFRDPPVTTLQQYKPFEYTLYGHTEAWGITALVLAGAVGVVALVTRRFALAGLGLASAVAGLGVAWTLGSVPDSQAAYLNYYLYFPLWPIGMAILATYAGALSSLVRAAAEQLRRRRDRTHVAPVAPVASRARRLGADLLGAALGLLLLAGGAGLLTVEVPIARSNLFLLGWEQVDFAREASAAALGLLRTVEPAGHRRPFLLEDEGGFAYMQSTIDQSVGYLLAVKGYPVRLGSVAAEPLGPALTAGADDPVLVLAPRASGHFSARWRPHGG